MSLNQLHITLPPMYIRSLLIDQIAAFVGNNGSEIPVQAKHQVTIAFKSGIPEMRPWQEGYETPSIFIGEGQG